MKWMVIKGVRYPSSVISAFAAYNMDNPFLKVRIRNKYHIVPFDDVNKMASQMVYLMDNYPDFVQIGRWWISKKAVMSFTYGVVRYVGTWGGCRTEKTLDGKLFYSSEECFKKGESIPKTRLSIYDVFESLYGFIPIGDVWKYKNGRAVKDKLEYFDVEIDDKGKIYCKETYYRTREDVYKFNDLTVVDRNGDIRLVESSKSRLMLSNDQLDVVERMKGIIDDMVRLKMIMYIDQDYNLCFLPGDKIEDLTMDETDGFVDTTSIVTSIKSKDVVEFYVENPFVKIKDE